MVKDEAAIIHRVVRSGAAIASHLFICDTGSTDDTISQALLAWGNHETAIKATKWDGFKDYEESRNFCKQKAAELVEQQGWPIKWVLLGDADFIFKKRAHYDPPGALINIIQMFPATPSQPHNALPLLVEYTTFRDDCTYRLWAHEELYCVGSTVAPDHYSGIYIVDVEDGKGRSHKIPRDISLLERWLIDVNTTELRPRALYYLARAYEDGGQYEKAAITYEWHSREETYTNYQFYALYRRALLVLRSNSSTTREVETAFLKAHDSYDGYFRWEPLYYLARYFRLKGNYNRCILYASAGANTPQVNHTRVPLFMEVEIKEKHVVEELEYCVKMKSLF